VIVCLSIQEGADTTNDIEYMIGVIEKRLSTLDKNPPLTMINAILNETLQAYLKQPQLPITINLDSE
jgi:hypothetical protein